MIVACNGHTQIIFIPYWISCLYESMSAWMNKFTCPGFVFFPCKPHPKGNEYHTICCGESGIMYGWEIVEMRDNPITMGWPESDKNPNMNTVGLMLWPMKALCITGKAVIMNSGFFFFKGILEMTKRGVYGSELIKKRRYWPRGVMYMELTFTLGQKILVMWDALVVNRTRKSLILLF